MVQPRLPRILKEFSHHQLERSSLSGERQLGWWTGNPDGALDAPSTGPLEITRSCLLPQEPLSMSFPWNAESIALLAQQCTPKPQRSHTNVQSWKVLFSSAKPCTGFQVVWNWLVGEMIEMGGIHEAGGAFLEISLCLLVPPAWIQGKDRCFCSKNYGILEEVAIIGSEFFITGNIKKIICNRCWRRNACFGLHVGKMTSRIFFFPGMSSL